MQQLSTSRDPTRRVFCVGLMLFAVLAAYALAVVLLVSP